MIVLHNLNLDSLYNQKKYQLFDITFQVIVLHNIKQNILSKRGCMLHNFLNRTFNKLFIFISTNNHLFSVV